MAMILDEGFGNAAVAAISIQGLEPGTLLLETCYAAVAPAPTALRLQRYLPAAPQRSRGSCWPSGGSRPWSSRLWT